MEASEAEVSRVRRRSVVPMSAPGEEQANVEQSGCCDGQADRDHEAFPSRATDHQGHPEQDRTYRGAEKPDEPGVGVELIELLQHSRCCAFRGRTPLVDRG